MENQPNAASSTHAGIMHALIEKIKDVKIAMLVTLDAEGRPHSRPMYTHEAGADGKLWFFTGKDSPKMDEIAQNPRVNLSYSKPEDDRYVSVSGKGTLVEDRAKIDELWNEMLKAWFPKGKEDPNVALLCVEVEHAEYWDTPDSKVVQLLGYVKAIVTGEAYHPGDNQKITA